MTNIMLYETLTHIERRIRLLYLTPIQIEIIKRTKLMIPHLKVLSVRSKPKKIDPDTEMIICAHIQADKHFK